MRIRTIKPSFWRSDDITGLPMDLRLLFIGLWSYVDDNGVGLDDYRQIAADLFALEEDQTAYREFVRDGLATLSRQSLVTCYMIEDKSYIFITKWDKHQKVDRPNKPRYPRPPDGFDPSTSRNEQATNQVETPSRQSRETPSSVVRSRGTGEESKKSPGGAVDHASTDHAPAIARDPHPTQTPLPDDWSPHDGHGILARKSGLDLEHEASQFRAWSLDKGRLSANWHEAFRYWLGRSATRPNRHLQVVRSQAACGDYWQD